MPTLSVHAIDVLESRMSIDVEHILEKVSTPEIRPYSDLVVESIEIYCDFVLNNNCASEVNHHFVSTAENVQEGSEIYLVLDSIRMAFWRYISGGMHELYTYQENEAWHPKINLYQVITPNDIDSLGETIEIFRGCDRSELDTGNVGQSWTTNLTVARDFAFQHYDGAEWLVEGNRVVLKAVCSRNDILFSDQTEYGEYEIVARQGSLSDVQVVT